jgi:hypothetical protein
MNIESMNILTTQDKRHGTARRGEEKQHNNTTQHNTTEVPAFKINGCRQVWFHGIGGGIPPSLVLVR